MSRAGIRTQRREVSSMPSHLCRIFWFLATALLLGCEPGYQVSGQVLSDRGPVQGARVALSSNPDRNTLSDEAGRFVLQGVPAGEYTLNTTYVEEDQTVSQQVEIVVAGNTSVEPLKLPLPVELTTTQGPRVPGKSTAVLSWSRAFKEGFREYKVYRHTTSGLDETTGTLVHVATDVDATRFESEEEPLKTYYYRVFVMNDYGKLGGSNIASLSLGAYVPPPALTLGQPVQAVLYVGAPPHLFHFESSAQALYTVRHAGNLDLTVFDATQSIIYAQDPRAIHMTGHPLLFPARATEQVYLRVSIMEALNLKSADYSLEVRELRPTEQILLMPGTPQSLRLETGAAQVLSFDAAAGTRYRLVAESTAAGAPASNQALTFVSVFGANVSAPYVWDQQVGLRGSPTSYEFTATRTERLTVTLLAAYWFEPTQVTLSLSAAP
jgi:hypothetical protein